MNIPGRYRYAAIPHLMVDGAAEAIQFYAEAFGGQELFRIADPEGTIIHAEVSIKGSIIMVGDADGPFKAPDAAGGSTVGLHVYVDDVDAFTDQAVRAGATLLQPPTDMFYGARSAMLKDPFGHLWVFLTHTEDLSTEEITRRGTDLLSTGSLFPTEQQAGTDSHVIHDSAAKASGRRISSTISRPIPTPRARSSGSNSARTTAERTRLNIDRRSRHDQNLASTKTSTPAVVPHIAEDHADLLSKDCRQSKSASLS